VRRIKRDMNEIDKLGGPLPCHEGGCEFLNTMEMEIANGSRHQCDTRKPCNDGKCKEFNKREKIVNEKVMTLSKEFLNSLTVTQIEELEFFILLYKRYSMVQDLLEEF